MDKILFLVSEVVSFLLHIFDISICKEKELR